MNYLGTLSDNKFVNKSKVPWIHIYFMDYTFSDASGFSDMINQRIGYPSLERDRRVGYLNSNVVAVQLEGCVSAAGTTSRTRGRYH